MGRMDLRFVEIQGFTRETRVTVGSLFAWQDVLMRFAISWLLIWNDKD